ncbi:divergent PAP2 family protein [Ktedonosporobacter rubrisoli]|uniref:Divergent PAP2 family protein n=1 Tax=Ktedonosporobacter rubrisoli TaxID=2509675 RepID=A0A4P6JQ91_KTERU|nr:divergent PAP2 family protein [Ktedonosporobacter rubrisoli]QBD77569.1 divergent PAP2 family protein [Ktedonosporobacter rubrisoli]
MDALLNNRVLIASFLAWAIAQIVKTIYAALSQHKLMLSSLVSSGGMPSAHSALVACMATAAGRLDGISSPAFAVAVVLAGIVMYDAAGVRRAVSVQARLLNQILDKLFQGQILSQQKLYELVGHTPIQVFAGGLLGILVGLVMTR